MVDKGTEIKIDIVLPWLDDRDEAWRNSMLEAKRLFQPEKESYSEIRFESWDNIHLWLRAIQKCMPWVKKRLIQGIKTVCGVDETLRKDMLYQFWMI